MTLTIHAEEDNQRQLKVKVEVAEERVQKQMRQTARVLGRTVHIPGFRKGKVPYNVLVRRLGEETLRAEAVEEILESLLAEALEEVDVEAYRQPTMDNMELKPLVLELTIPLEPTVVLGDYRAIRKEIEPIEVTDEALADALEHVRSHHQVLEAVERPAETGDMVTLGGVGTVTFERDDDVEDDDVEEDVAEGDEIVEDDVVEDGVEDNGVEDNGVEDGDVEDGDIEDGDIEDDDIEDGLVTETFWEQESVDLVMDPKETFPGLPFVENIIGLSAGDEKEFSFTFPDDFEDEDLAGKEATMQVDILNVQSRYLPELDDELAQKEGDYETLAELETSLREQLYKQAEEQAKNELLDEMVDEMLADAEMNYPPAAVESEIDNSVESFKQQVQQAGLEWDDYLKFSGGDASLRAQFREGADERVRRGIILRQFIEAEYLMVETADIDAVLEDRLSRFDDEAIREQVRNLYMQGGAAESLANDIMLDKVYERMQAIVTGSAPDLAELAAAAEAAAAADEEE